MQILCGTLIFFEGEITRKGFNKEHAGLWTAYQSYLSDNNLKPVHATTTQVPKDADKDRPVALKLNNTEVKNNQSSFDSYLMKKQLRAVEVNSSIKAVEGKSDKAMHMGQADIAAMKAHLKDSHVGQNNSFVFGQVNFLHANDSKKYAVSSHKTRKLNAALTLEDIINIETEERGHLPWEKQHLFSEITKVCIQLQKLIVL